MSTQVFKDFEGKVIESFTYTKEGIDRIYTITFTDGTVLEISGERGEISSRIVKI